MALLPQRFWVQGINGTLRRCWNGPHGVASEQKGMPGTLVSIVEDDLFFRESMRRLMRSLGYAVETFSSAADFLGSPRLLETACLISDVQMPVMSGLELYQSLINSGHTIPTILITAYPNDADRDRALDDGVICYLGKPVDETLLRRCLCEVLGTDKDS